MKATRFFAGVMAGILASTLAFTDVVATSQNAVAASDTPSITLNGTTFMGEPGVLTSKSLIMSSGSASRINYRLVPNFASGIATNVQVVIYMPSLELVGDTYEVADRGSPATPMGVQGTVKAGGNWNVLSDTTVRGGPIVLQYDDDLGPGVNPAFDIELTTYTDGTDGPYGGVPEGTVFEINGFVTYEMFNRVPESEWTSDNRLDDDSRVTVVSTDLKWEPTIVPFVQDGGSPVVPIWDRYQYMDYIYTLSNTSTNPASNIDGYSVTFDLDTTDNINGIIPFDINRFIYGPNGEAIPNADPDFQEGTFVGVPGEGGVLIYDITDWDGVSELTEALPYTYSGAGMIVLDRETGADKQALTPEASPGPSESRYLVSLPMSRQGFPSLPTTFKVRAITNIVLAANANWTKTKVAEREVALPTYGFTFAHTTKQPDVVYGLETWNQIADIATTSNVPVFDAWMSYGVDEDFTVDRVEYLFDASLVGRFGDAEITYSYRDDEGVTQKGKLTGELDAPASGTAALVFDAEELEGLDWDRELAFTGLGDRLDPGDTVPLTIRVYGTPSRIGTMTLPAVANYFERFASNADYSEPTTYTDVVRTLQKNASFRVIYPNEVIPQTRVRVDGVNDRKTVPFDGRSTLDFLFGVNDGTTAQDSTTTITLNTSSAHAVTDATLTITGLLFQSAENVRVRVVSLDGSEEELDVADADGSADLQFPLPNQVAKVIIDTDQFSSNGASAFASVAGTIANGLTTQHTVRVHMRTYQPIPYDKNSTRESTGIIDITLPNELNPTTEIVGVYGARRTMSSTQVPYEAPLQAEYQLGTGGVISPEFAYTIDMLAPSTAVGALSATRIALSDAFLAGVNDPVITVVSADGTEQTFADREVDLADVELDDIAKLVISGTQLKLPTTTTIAIVDYDSALDMGASQQLRARFSGSQNLPYTAIKTSTRTNSVQVAETKTTVRIEGANQVERNPGAGAGYDQWVERNWYCNTSGCGSKTDYTLDQGYKSLGGFVGTITRPTTTYTNNDQTVALDVTLPSEQFDLYYLKINEKLGDFIEDVEIYRTVDGVETLWKTIDGDLWETNTVEGTYWRIGTARPATDDGDLFLTPGSVDDPHHPYYKSAFDADAAPSQPVSRVRINLAFTRESADHTPQLSGTTSRVVEYMGRFYETSTAKKATSITTTDTFGVTRPITRSYVGSPIHSLVAHPYAQTRTGAEDTTSTSRKVIMMGSEGHYLASIWNITNASWYIYNGHGPDIYSPVATEFDEWLYHYDPASFHDRLIYQFTYPENPGSNPDHHLDATDIVLPNTSTLKYLTNLRIDYATFEETETGDGETAALTSTGTDAVTLTIDDALREQILTQPQFRVVYDDTLPVGFHQTGPGTFAVSLGNLGYPTKFEATFEDIGGFGDRTAELQGVAPDSLGANLNEVDVRVGGLVNGNRDLVGTTRLYRHSDADVIAGRQPTLMHTTSATLAGYTPKLGATIETTFDALSAYDYQANGIDPTATQLRAGMANTSEADITDFTMTLALDSAFRSRLLEIPAEAFDDLWSTTKVVVEQPTQTVEIDLARFRLNPATNRYELDIEALFDDDVLVERPLDVTFSGTSQLLRREVGKVHLTFSAARDAGGSPLTRMWGSLARAEDPTLPSRITAGSYAVVTGVWVDETDAGADWFSKPSFRGEKAKVDASTPYYSSFTVSASGLKTPQRFTTSASSGNGGATPSLGRSGSNGTAPTLRHRLAQLQLHGMHLTEDLAKATASGGYFFDADTDAQISSTNIVVGDTTKVLYELRNSAAEGGGSLPVFEPRAHVTAPPGLDITDLEVVTADSDPQIAQVIADAGRTLITPNADQFSVANGADAKKLRNVVFDGLWLQPQESVFVLVEYTAVNDYSAQLGATQNNQVAPYTYARPGYLHHLQNYVMSGMGVDGAGADSGVTGDYDGDQTAEHLARVHPTYRYANPNRLLITSAFDVESLSGTPMTLGLSRIENELLHDNTHAVLYLTLDTRARGFQLTELPEPAAADGLADPTVEIEVDGEWVAYDASVHDLAHVNRLRIDYGIVSARGGDGGVLTLPAFQVHGIGHWQPLGGAATKSYDITSQARLVLTHHDGSGAENPAVASYEYAPTATQRIYKAIPVIDFDLKSFDSKSEALTPDAPASALGKTSYRPGDPVHVKLTARNENTDPASNTGYGKAPLLAPVIFDKVPEYIEEVLDDHIRGGELDVAAAVAKGDLEIRHYDATGALRDDVDLPTVTVREITGLDVAGDQQFANDRHNDGWGLLSSAEPSNTTANPAERIRFQLVTYEFPDALGRGERIEIVYSGKIREDALPVATYSDDRSVYAPLSGWYASNAPLASTAHQYDMDMAALLHDAGISGDRGHEMTAAEFLSTSSSWVPGATGERRQPNNSPASYTIDTYYDRSADSSLSHRTYLQERTDNVLFEAKAGGAQDDNWRFELAARVNDGAVSHDERILWAQDAVQLSRAWLYGASEMLPDVQRTSPNGVSDANFYEHDGSLNHIDINRRGYTAYAYDSYTYAVQLDEEFTVRLHASNLGDYAVRSGVEYLEVLPLGVSPYGRDGELLGVTAFDGAGNEIALAPEDVQVIQKPGDPIVHPAPAQSQEAGTYGTATFDESAPYVLRIRVRDALTGMFAAPASTSTSKHQRVDVRVRVAEESSHLVNDKAYWYDQLTVTSIGDEPYLEVYGGLPGGTGYGAFSAAVGTYNTARYPNDGIPQGLELASLVYDFGSYSSYFSIEPYGTYIRGLNAQGTRTTIGEKPALVTGDQIAMRTPTLRVWNAIEKDSYTTSYHPSIQDYTVDLYERFTVHATVENQQIEAQNDYIRARSGYNWYSGDYLNDDVWTRQPQIIGGARGSWFDPTVTVALPYGVVPVLENGDIARYDDDLADQQEVAFTATISDVTSRSTTPVSSAAGIALTDGDVSEFLKVAVERIDSDHGKRFVLHFTAKSGATAQKVLHEIAYNQSLTVSPRVMVVDSPSFGADADETKYQQIVALAHTERPVSHPLVSGLHTTGSVPSGRSDWRDGSIGNGALPFDNDQHRRDSTSTWASNMGALKITERLISATQKFTPSSPIALHTDGSWNVSASELLPDEVTAATVSTGASGGTQLVLRQPTIVNSTKAGTFAESAPAEILPVDAAGKFWISTEVRNRAVVTSDPYQQIQTAGDVHNSRFLVTDYVTSFAKKTGDVRLVVDGEVLDRAQYTALGYTVEQVTENERVGAGERQRIQWMVTTPDQGSGTFGKLRTGERFELRYQLELVDGFDEDLLDGSATWQHPSLTVDSYVSLIPNDRSLIEGDQRVDDFIVQPIDAFGYESLVVESPITPDYDADSMLRSRFAWDPMTLEIIKPQAEVRVNTTRPRLVYTSLDPENPLTGDTYFNSSDLIEYLVTHAKNTGSALKEMVVEQILPTNESNDPSVRLSTDEMTTTLLYVRSGVWEFPQSTLDRLERDGKTVDDVFEVEVLISKETAEAGYEAGTWVSLGTSSTTASVEYEIPSSLRLGEKKMRVIVRSLDSDYLVPTGTRLAIDADPTTPGSQDVIQTDPANLGTTEFPAGVTDNAITVGMRAASYKKATIFIYDTAQVWGNYVADAMAKVAQADTRSYLTPSRPVVNIKHDALYFRSDNTRPTSERYGWSDNTAIKTPGYLKFRGELTNADESMWDPATEGTTYSEDTLIDPVMSFELPSVMSVGDGFTYVPSTGVTPEHPLHDGHRSQYPLTKDDDAYRWTWKLVRADGTEASSDSYLTHTDMYAGPWPGMDHNVATVWFEGMVYPGDKIVFEFIGLVEEYTPGAASNDVKSRVYATNSTGLLQPLNSEWNRLNRLGYMTDKHDLDDNRLLSDRLVFAERQLFQYETYDNFGKRKTAYSDLNKAGTVSPALTPVPEGGDYRFTVSLDNTKEPQDTPYPYPIIYDVLPHPDDTSIMNVGVPRQSQSSGLLDLDSISLRKDPADTGKPAEYPANAYTVYVGPFTKQGNTVVESTLVPAAQAATQTFYDDLATPGTASTLRSSHFVTLAEFRAATATDPTLLAKARALLVMFNDAAASLPGQSRLTLSYSMRSPINAPALLETWATDETPADVAQWNSFVGTQRKDGFKPQESNNAGVYVTEQAGTVSIGNYVWHDVDYDGIQNEGTAFFGHNGRTLLEPSQDLDFDGTIDDPGINGVTVTLLTERGHVADARGRAIARHLGAWVVVDDITGAVQFDDLGQTTQSDGPMTTVTQTDFYGHDGYYVFSNIAPGTYRVMYEFPSTYENYGVTTPTVYGDVVTVTEYPKGDAASIPAEAATNALVAITDPARVDERTVDSLRMSFDIGIAEQIRLGGVIWNDADRNGLRVPAEPKLAGYHVSLTTTDGEKVLDRDGEPYTVTTKADGAYEFRFLPREREYLVEVRNPQGGYDVKMPVTPKLRSANPFEFSDDNDGVLVELDDESLIVRSNPLGLDLRGLFVSGFADRMNVDIGFYQRSNAAVIGDRVWNDLDRNGLQDLGEPGVPGQKLHLHRYLQDEDGDWVRDEDFDQTAVSDANGFYSFDTVEAFDLLQVDELIEYRYALSVEKGELVAGYTFAPALQGARADLDSDFRMDGTMGVTSDGGRLISLIASVDADGDPVLRDDVTIDLGLMAHATAFLAGEVFIDREADGVKLGDALAEQRFTATLQVRANGGAWTDVASQTTVSAYRFDDLPIYHDASGTLLEYRVVVTEIPLWLRLTAPNAGSDGIDSDFVEDARGATITAVSDVYVLAEPIEGHLLPIDTRTAISQPTVDLGLLEPDSVIGGKVWEDADLDGIRTEDEQPIADRVVALWELVGGEWVPAEDLDGRGVAVSDANGDYRFRVSPMHFDDRAPQFLQPRVYRVTAQRDGWQTWSPANVGGDVLVDSDMTAPAEEFGTIHTGVSNLFSIVELDGGLAVPATQRDDVQMDMGLRSLKHTVVVGGSAWGESHVDGLRQDGESPLAGLTVTLWELVDDEWVVAKDATGVSTRQTGEDGRYAFIVMPVDFAESSDTYLQPRTYRTTVEVPFGYRLSDGAGVTATLSGSRVESIVADLVLFDEDGNVILDELLDHRTLDFPFVQDRLAFTGFGGLTLALALALLLGGGGFLLILRRRRRDEREVIAE